VRHFKQPGECRDSRGIPIYPGDLLRMFHFLGPRRKRYYQYFVAVWDAPVGGMRLVPACHLDPQVRVHPLTRGGSPLLDNDLAAIATIIAGCSINGCLLYDERPRKAEAAGGEQ